MAQDGLTMNLMPSYANSVVNTSVRDSMLGVNSYRRSKPPPYRANASRSSPRTAEAAPVGVATTYRASPGVTERVKRQYIDFVAKQGPGDLNKAREEVGRLDPVRVWSRGVAEDGLHPGDVADAMASYWVLNWAVANGGDNTREQMLAVRRNLQPTIASNPAFTRLSDAQKQEMAEALMINYIFQREVYTRALQAHDEPLLARLRAAAVARFQHEAGVDLRRIALTDQGFVNRG